MMPSSTTWKHSPSNPTTLTATSIWGWPTRVRIREGRRESALRSAWVSTRITIVQESSCSCYDWLFWRTINGIFSIIRYVWLILCNKWKWIIVISVRQTWYLISWAVFLNCWLSWRLCVVLLVKLWMMALWSSVVCVTTRNRCLVSITGLMSWRKSYNIIKRTLNKL